MFFGVVRVVVRVVVVLIGIEILFFKVFMMLKGCIIICIMVMVGGKL